MIYANALDKYFLVVHNGFRTLKIHLRQPKSSQVASGGCESPWGHTPALSEAGFFWRSSKKMYGNIKERTPRLYQK